MILSENLNFHYAAYSYLDEWISKDLEFHRAFAFDRPLPLSDEDGAKCLVEAATYYGVIRTLRKNQDEEFRLVRAYKALQRVSIFDEEDLAQTVESLARELGQSNMAWSAASKFLWMRFRSPVIIYDSIVDKWLYDHSDYKDDTYANYCKFWLEKYREYSPQIGEACAELNSVKKFTLIPNVPDHILAGWINNEWFRQRVFDHAMLNDSNLKLPDDVRQWF